MSTTVRLELIGLPDTDEEELRHLSGRLRRTLLDLDVADARQARSRTDGLPGAKSGELVAAGTVLVTATPLVLHQVLKLVDTWLQNRPVRGIKVELDGRAIELSNASDAERQRLIDAFLAQLDQSDDDATDSEQQPPFLAS